MNVLFIDGKVKKFARKLDHETKTKMGQLIRALEYFGHDIGMPYSRSIGQGLFELRIRGRQEVRIFYIFHKGEAVLLHACIKKSEKIREKELQVAQWKKKLLDET